MKQKSLLLVFAVLLIALTLSACNRSASQPPTGLITATAELPFEFEDGPITTAIIAQTQTASVALGTPAIPKEPDTQAGGGVGTPSEATPLPLPTSTVAPQVQPTQAPAPQTWSPTAGVPSTYTVNKGEFAYCLARRFNVHPGDLLSLNGLGPNTLLNPGTSLRIPTGSQWPSDAARSLQSHPTTYTVRAGDTIYSIACAFGDVDPNGIIAINNLSAPYSLTAGQSLNIP